MLCIYFLEIPLLYEALYSLLVVPIAMFLVEICIKLIYSCITFQIYGFTSAVRKGKKKKCMFWHC